ncbi:MarR family winged helix-turn-helix transcriptional regulator [Paracoccus sp. P2]|uniref:MarR family transcriptional regulator n=1 Tax=Paracoccus pantotrophus TaxID=82367 RepID=A0A1I5HNQ5_PARPN|nr:MarR family transcriptional regulator [Paracoccus pantotrophus]MDF3853763.1 MarR family transcriptional regulator [Paracoccus pantotrophus]QFG36530.1 MarR family transcriptional regulator [Paracoccus pantotrophus]QLH16808.1 MarR family transcriptional regulator [Paracoccus pantotrophus]RDD96180.1 MarR family transcriptional regulator [Paracoccus pantotrophus]RKS42877.1 MarR family transcriptional regulator for hemolysin [Paracoccus pantotrophus]
MTNHPTPARGGFGRYFVTLGRQWRRAVEQALAPAGLTDATWAPLIHLAEGGDGISQTELAARLALDGSTLVRLLDLLEGRGLVERRPDPADRRARRILLTAAGRDEVARLRRLLDRIEAELLADLDDAALDEMLRHLSRIEARIAHRLAVGQE